MNVARQNEILKRRNAKLALELEEAKNEIERLKAKSSDRLFEEYQDAKTELEQVIADLKVQRKKYTALNQKLALALNELRGKKGKKVSS